MTTPLRLGDPRLRLALGTGALLLSAVPLHPDRVGPLEERAFRRINDLPDCLLPVAWPVMQFGNVATAVATAAVAALHGHRALAGRLLAGGVITWAASKVVKPVTGRPRPGALLPGARSRGREAMGLGFPSGHAGVATALTVAALPHLDPTARRTSVALVAVVGLTRIYVGAHLPLDIMSGAALGLSIEALVELLDVRPSG